MKRKDHFVALALAVVAGFVGGCMSGRLVSPGPVIAQESPKRVKIIETESLHLLDKAGKIRVVLEVLGDDNVVLAMGNKEGILRTKLGVDSNGNAYLDLKDEKGQSHGLFFVNAAGSPTVMLVDQNGRSGALLGEGDIPISDVGIVITRPAGSLVFLNKDGKAIWRAP